MATRITSLPLLLQTAKWQLDERTDSRLLADFLDCRDEEAFEHLVRRHAGHVWSVCSRLLKNPADAEDAFQATFIVLIRSGRMIADRGAIGSWLYGVAYRVALKALAMTAKRHHKEKRAAKAEMAPDASGSASHRAKQPCSSGYCRPVSATPRTAGGKSAR